MKARMVTIPEEEYKRLKKETSINIELIRKIRRSLEDIKHGRVKRWKNN